jgi:hypothetical protein
MNEMNSLTHSCMHSLASFAIFAFSGRAVFMIRATGAKLQMDIVNIRTGRRRRTICYWKPAILLFNFKLVRETRGEWVLRIHLRIWIFRRRVGTLSNVRIFGRRGRRHIYRLPAGSG